MRGRWFILFAGVLAGVGCGFVSPAGAVRSAASGDGAPAPAVIDVKAFGDAHFVGSTSSGTINEPIVGMAGTESQRGYWEVASDGGVFTFGDAKFYGSTGAIHLNQPIVGMAATPSGNGYWLVARDGGVFTFGDAKFLGSMGSVHLNQPVVGMASTPTGAGYWLVARDGGIFTFGDAKFRGSTGGFRLNQPITGMGIGLSGNGYWLVAGDGGIFTFGDAKYFGSLGGSSLDQSIVAMAVTPGGDGYWLADSGGRVFAFGRAPALGDAAGSNLSMPVVDIASRSAGGFWLAGRGSPTLLNQEVSEPGCAPDGSQREVRPASFLLACGDGNSQITNATWSSWTADHASGIGTLSQNDCEPDCAEGHFHSQGARLTLFAPVVFHGNRVFSLLRVDLNGPLFPLKSTTVTFTLV